ncbi:spore germination B3 GerAC family protein [Desulforamulus reducens MI-1]|uniref:Spore germination B3 GerAC family protein n=1 Tax=Desulforamulus reducens (strain ATCC BAA-1160 / DSM 100696 / MI-1) TaxID=349161 RepID=A4J0K0_DESRM|nr:Ger(x)C family spore germination protein [Desulforamulus reducens]ABO48603.1 spore germination B3 GerAC family protein [Desulforamulus reducens MI-1]
MKAKLIPLLAIFFITFFSSGCWDHREAENTGIIIGAGIDQTEDGKIIVIGQTMIPQQPGAGGGDKTGEVISFHNWYATGETLFDAIRDLTLQSPTPLFWSHAQVIVFSERLARKGLLEAIDFLERDPEIKQSTWVLIAQGDLNDVMQTREMAFQPPTKIMADVIKTRNRNAKYAVTSLGDFLRTMDNPDTQPFTAGVNFFKGPMKDMNKLTSRVQEAPREYEIKISDTAVFHEDKMVGWFNTKESRGLLFIKGEIKSGVLVLEKEKQRLSVEMFGSSSKLKPVVQDGQLVMKVEIKVTGSLAEALPGIYELDKKVVKDIEQQMNTVVKEEVMAAITRAQELNTDVLGFGRVVHQHFPKEWDKELAQSWPELFKDLEVEVTVDGKIKTTGLITTSVNPRKKNK